MPLPPKTPPDSLSPPAPTPAAEPTGSGRDTAAALRGALRAPVTIAEQVLAGTPAPVFYLGAGALAVAGVVEWPVVGLVAAGTWLARRQAAGSPRAADNR